MWGKEISPSGMNILIRDSPSLVPDKNIHPSGEISLSHMDTHDGFYYSLSVCLSVFLSLLFSLLSQINGFILIINECTCISACMDLPINFFRCFSLQRNGTITDFVSFYTLPSTIMHHPQHKLLKAAYSFYNVSTATPWVDLMQDALIVAKNVCVTLLKRLADLTI